MAERVEEVDDASASLRSQAEIWKHISASVTSMVLKCAVELRIADIIHSHGDGGPITLSQIASAITDSPSLNISYLERIMRLLVHKGIFTARHPSDGGETLYGLTDLSKWILWDAKPSLAPHVMVRNHPLMMAPWHYLGQSVKDGGFAFQKAHGCSNFWEFATSNPEINNLLTDSMSSTFDTELPAFLQAYKDELGRIGSLVDVGGRTGRDLYEIVKSHPHIKAINFDLPDVIAAAPVFEGVSHVGGDMFEAIPSADAVIMKTTIRDWTDEKVVEILKNCRKAIPKNTGKVIILDIVIGLGNHNIFEENHIISDLSMLTLSTGRERTEMEWKKLLKEGGFPRYKVIQIPARTCIIEACPL
jgi:hypothetical protein